MNARDEYERLDRGDDRYDRYDDRYDDGYYEDDYYEEGYIDGEDGPYITRGDSENAAGFFADCKTPGEIKRRYHDLCKVYHPDSGNGSAEIFYRIKTEYDRLNAKS